MEREKVTSWLAISAGPFWLRWTYNFWLYFQFPVLHCVWYQNLFRASSKYEEALERGKEGLGGKDILSLQYLSARFVFANRRTECHYQSPFQTGAKWRSQAAGLSFWTMPSRSLTPSPALVTPPSSSNLLVSSRGPTGRKKIGYNLQIWLENEYMYFQAWAGVWTSGKWVERATHWGEFKSDDLRQECWKGFLPIFGCFVFDYNS